MRYYLDMLKTEAKVLMDYVATVESVRMRDLIDRFFPNITPGWLRPTQLEIGRWLREAGWQSRMSRAEGGKHEKIWISPDSTRNKLRQP